MAEAGEGNPATNFQKTVGFQNERVKAAEKPLNLVDMLAGRWTTGSVESSYSRGSGGIVNTRIECGGAVLDQRWKFDEDGKLDSVAVYRMLRVGSAYKDAGKVRLSRDENGRFQIQESSSSHALPDWAKQFHTAKARMAASRNRPSTSQPLQK